MPRRRAPQASPTSWLNGGTIINILGIPLITAIFIGGGYYYTTRDILAQHTAEIAKEVATREAAMKEENEGREKIRNALINYADKTQHSIDTLAAHGMVQDEQIKAVNGTLDKVVNGLQGMEMAIGRIAPKK